MNQDLSSEEEDPRSEGEPSASQNDNSSFLTSSRRLLKELNDITFNPPPLCSAGMKGNDIYEWVATIMGPPGTAYEGGIFNLSVQFPKQYPFLPPKMMFTTPIYHCNISSKGHICLDILKKKWSPALTISSVLLSLCSLLSDCNPDDPLMHNIAALYMSNREEHDRRARRHTRKYASPEDTPENTPRGGNDL